MNNVFIFETFIFAICGIVGALGSLAITKDTTGFSKTIILAIIFSIITGIVTKRFVINEIEIAGVFSTIVAIFMSDIIREIREILENVSEVVVDSAKKKIDKKIDEDKK